MNASIRTLSPNNDAFLGAEWRRVPANRSISSEDPIWLFRTRVPIVITKTFSIFEPCETPPFRNLPTFDNHDHAPKTAAAFAAIVCSNSRACAFSTSNSSFNASNCALKSSSLTSSPGATPT